MGLKKYEIITVGSDKRVRALRSWQVGDRYVNIGDTGGIVYDEKTLSQDGACWLFRGNFGFPGARIGGDSIVDVGEATLPDNGSPAVDILGSSVVVGSKLLFESEKTAADAVVLGLADLEQGSFGPFISGNLLTKTDSTQYVRPKNLIFAGGRPVTLKCEVPGYTVTAVAVDRDGIIKDNSSTTSSGAGVSVTVPAGQYFTFRISKDPTATINPSEAAEAQITFTGVYDTKLSIIDSRVEINPATGTGTTIIRPGGTYTFASGTKYPEAIIRNSKVSMSVPAVASRSYRIMGQIIESNATLDATARDVSVAGQYSNIKNLMASGTITSNLGVTSYNVIQATNCNDFAVSPTIFPGLATAQTANMPFIFQGCNVPNGIFYHHVQIANTYKNIDFALAQDDLGKIVSGRPLVSSEVEGMYRYVSATGAMGPLIEAYNSVESLNMTGGAATYGTTIYKDAYVSGKFDLAGTNVFGNKVRSRPLAQVLNVQPRAVRGGFNTETVPPTNVPGQLTNTVMNEPLRINGANGLKVENVPAGVRYMYVILDANLKFIQNSQWKNGTSTIEAAALHHPYAMIQFNRESGGGLTPADLADVTVTVYNGCKITNTGETAVNMKGNIRVEDNATLINASVTGSGYFGGNSITSGVTIGGEAYVKDNAVIVVPDGSASIRSLKMTENAYAAPVSITLNGHLWLSGNSRFTPAAAASGNGDLFMEDNAVISGSVSVSGSLTMKDNATVSAGTLTAYGDMTICGSYRQTVNKTWIGKRAITDVNEPEYDNNVKTQYDF